MGTTILRSKEYQWQCWALRALVCTVLLLAAACGGDKGGSTDESGTVTVRPGQRLMWDQAADSIQQLKTLTFKLFVDGAESALTAPSCAERPGMVYQCSGGLPPMAPGRHVLELSTVLNGKESPRSPPFVVMMTSSSGLISPVAPLNVGVSSLHESTACSSVSGSECYGVRVVAAELGDVKALSPTADGRLFFVEGGQTVRVIAGGRLLPETVLSFSDSSARIVGMAADADFDSTRAIFVAWTSRPEGRAPTLSLTRYRELHNTLAQGATLVTGLPFQDDHVGPLAVDRSGLVYLALPAAPGEPSGAIMRFTRDGFVPRENPRVTPIISEGYTRPAEVAVDAGGRVWLSGTSAGAPEPVSSFAILKNDARWPISPSALRETTQARPPAGSRLLREIPPTVLIAGADQLFQGFTSLDGEAELERVHFGASIPVIAAARGPNGVGYVATVMEAGTAILELKPFRLPAAH